MARQEYTRYSREFKLEAVRLAETSDIARTISMNCTQRPKRIARAFARKQRLSKLAMYFIQPTLMRLRIRPYCARRFLPDTRHDLPP